VISHVILSIHLLTHHTADDKNLGGITLGNLVHFSSPQLNRLRISRGKLDSLPMIISAYQPYFAPFSGFFAKALRSDLLVIMDRVQFPRGTTWLTRNRFKNDQGTLWMTIPVWKKGLGLQKIDEVRICHEGRWARKHLVSLKSAYANAPFF